MTVVPTPVWRRILRAVIWGLGNILIKMFTRSTISGTENFPKRGPYIVAGNHRGIMEAFLMLAACPREVEVLGAGDVPLDRRYRYFAWLYGFIPYNRGQMDRPALKKAVKVLDHGGIVGIFPEGGIWQAARKSAHRGVAWLSFSSKAPVVPVGFGGVFQAVERAARFELPKVERRVGKPIPIPGRDRGVTRKEQMETHAEVIMDHIEELIPDWDRREHTVPTWEEFSLSLEFARSDRRTRLGQTEETAMTFTEAPLLSRLLHLPVLIDTLYFNMNRRQVAPLRFPNRFHPTRKLLRAVRVVLGYAVRTNPTYFEYRLGDERSAEMVAGLVKLAWELTSAMESGKELVRVIPRHAYRMPDSDQTVVTTTPPRGGNL